MYRYKLGTDWEGKVKKTKKPKTKQMMMMMMMTMNRDLVIYHILY